MSHRQYKEAKERSIETQGKISFIDDNRSINNETDDKIKRKIIEKYSKNPKIKNTNATKIEKPLARFTDKYFVH